MKYYCAWCRRYHVYGRGKVYDEHKGYAINDKEAVKEAEKLFGDFLRNFHVIEKRYVLDLSRDVAIALACEFARARYHAWIFDDRVEVDFLGRRLILVWGGDSNEL